MENIVFRSQDLYMRLIRVFLLPGPIGTEVGLCVFVSLYENEGMYFIYTLMYLYLVKPLIHTGTLNPKPLPRSSFQFYLLL